MKKMTKILSLVLALAMVLSMTALADGTVYYVQKFDYADMTEMLADMASYSFGKVNYTNTATLFTAKETAEGKQMWTMSSSSGVANAARSEIWATSDGVKMFGQQRKSGDWGTMLYAFDKEWNMWENQNEIFVVSFDAVTEGVENNTTSTAGYGYIKLYNRTDAAEDGTFTGGTYSIAGLYKNAYSAAVEDDPATEDKDETKAAVDSHFQYGYYTKLNNENSVAMKTFNPNQVYRIAQGLFCNEGAESASVAFPIRRGTLDGVSAHADGTTSAGAGKPIISGLSMQNRNTLKFSYGNIRVYTIDKTDGAFNVSAPVDTNVSTTTEKITVKFSQPVSPATFDKTAVTVTKNGALVDAADFEVSDVREVIADGKIWSEADVEMDLDYASTYEIAFAATTSNEMLMTLGENNTVTFTTETAPSFNIAINAYEGLAAGTAITADAMAGKTVYFTANATNTTGRAVAGDIAIGIYDANGNLVKVAYANKAFADAGAASFSAAFKMEAGYTAKAFVKGTASEIAFQ